MAESTFKQICKTAIIRSGVLRDKQPIEILETLALTFLEYKQYEKFTKKEFVQGFNEFFHLKINGIVLNEVFNKLIKNGYLEKNGIENFKPNYSLIIQLNNLSHYQQIELDTKLLLESFITYAKGFDKNLVIEDAENLLTKQIEFDSSIFGDSINRAEMLTSSELYLVSSFIKHIKEHTPSLYEIYTKIVVGRLLASFLCSNTDKSVSDIKFLDSLTFVLDTGFILDLFGFDLYTTSDEYVDLLTTLNGLGAKFSVFRHTYNELLDVLENSKRQISNRINEQGRFARTTLFFINNNYSIEDIDDIILNFEKLLEKYEISVIDCDIDYNSFEATQFNEQTVLNILHKQYKATGYYQKEKENTYYLDAKSIVQIHFLRKGRVFKDLAKCKYVFLTTNRGVAQVGKACTKTKDNISYVPYVISDAYLSLIVSFVYPQYSDETNLKFIIPAAYHAFKPNNEMMFKMKTVLKELNDSNIYTENQVFNWLTNKSLIDEVVYVTQNNPDNFDSNTPDKVIEKIKNDANILVDQISSEAEHKIKKANDERDEVLANYIQLEEKNRVLLKELEKKNNSKIHDLIIKRTKLQKKIKRRTFVFTHLITIVFYLCFIVSLAGLTVYFGANENLAGFWSSLGSIGVTVLAGALTYKKVYYTVRVIMVKLGFCKKKENEINKINFEIEALKKSISEL